MAFDFSKLNFFSRLDARARVVVLFVALIGFIALIYLLTTYFAGGENTVGPSKVANAPAGLQSIPGGTTATAEYQRALTQANAQAAEAARMSGGSAIPTQINTGMNFGASCVICSDKSANVKNLLSDWVRQGKVSPDVSNMLEELANKKVSPEEYANVLSQLVKSGKLTPEQARALLDEYKKQYANEKLADSEKMMDGLIKSGALPLAVANELLAAQRDGMSTADYAAKLQQLVRDGKISPATAQQLMQQYTAQCTQNAINRHIVTIKQMQESGGVTEDVAKKLIELTNNNTPIDAYSAQLNALVAQGKLTPVASSNLISAYQKVKSACGAVSIIDQMLKQAENEAFQELSDLLAAKKISADTAAQLTSLIQNDVSLDTFKATVAQMQQEGKLTPEIAQLKIGDYVKVKSYRDAKAMLDALQANNASASDYAAGLKKLVQAGLITPEQAAKMLQDYQAMSVRAAATTPLAGGAFGELQQRVQQGAAAQVPAGISATEFQAAQTQTTNDEEERRQARLQALMSAMSDQAGQLISSWQAPVMQHKAGSFVTDKDKLAIGKQGTTTATATGTEAAAGELGAKGPPLIKGGTIIFGVLDTAINSDYLDSPIMVTIVEGKFKGAKLLGKIATAKSTTGQMDRVSLNFTLMNDNDWPTSKSVTAYAIDPDTARTVMASSVDYHYMMRFGAIMATSFLQGYSTAITNEGTSTTGIFGTSTTHPALSGGSKIMVGLGQVGQTLGAATQNYINRSPTVRVDSGVSLGVLFMSDVT